MYEMMQESGLTEVIPFNMYLSHLEPVSIFFFFFLNIYIYILSTSVLTVWSGCSLMAAR